MLDLRTPPVEGRNGRSVSLDSSDLASELVELCAEESAQVPGTPSKKNGTTI